MIKLVTAKLEIIMKAILIFRFITVHPFFIETYLRLVETRITSVAMTIRGNKKTNQQPLKRSVIYIIPVKVMNIANHELEAQVFSKQP